MITHSIYITYDLVRNPVVIILVKKKKVRNRVVASITYLKFNNYYIKCVYINFIYLFGNTSPINIQGMHDTPQPPEK